MKKLILFSTTFLLFTILSSAQTITIGKQIWSGKNLDVVTFRNGDSIPEAKTNDEWLEAGQNLEPAWCYYNNDSANNAKYGKLYNWYAMNDPRGIAPAGWHVPTDDEWNALQKALGGIYSGQKMKSITGWKETHGEDGKKYSGNGTNVSGFNAFPAGFRDFSGNFLHETEMTFFWGSTELADNVGRHIRLDCGTVDANPNVTQKDFGISIRCIKD